MKYCPKCKKSYSDKSNYCSKCGSKLLDEPISIGSIFTKEDEDFGKFNRGFTF